MPIWNPRMETMPRVDLEQMQLERLQVLVNRLWEGVPFYRKRFEELGIIPEQVRSLEDLRQLPFTVKEDLRKAYPYNLFAVPLREVVRMHASSGTTGAPTVVGYTKNDLRHWRELVARVLSAAGVTKEDVIQISFSYGLLTSAFGFHQGAEEIGASVIPVSAAAVEQQIGILQDFLTTTLVGTPTYALQVAEALHEKGVSRAGLHLRWGVFGSEPWSEEVREKIESMLGISASDNYAISEVMGPGVSGECEHKHGLHLNEDHFLCEIVNPATGEVLPAGEEGELVITTLSKEALPILRYRTGDITSLNLEACPCGRTLARMARVFRRTDDLIIVNGIKIVPAQIEKVLAEVEGLKPRYQVVVGRSGASDRLEVRVEISAKSFTGDISDLVSAQNRLRQRLEGELGVAAEVRFVEAGGVNSPGKV